jgi:Ca2+-binding EF-hand superfamily protein
MSVNQKTLKKVNKIKSIREILDYNGNGKVESNELITALSDEELMKRVKALNPMIYFLMKNQGMKLSKVDPKKADQTNLIKSSIKNYVKDKKMFVE